MSEDVLLLYFPNELLEHILKYKEISYVDVNNFSLTCTKFRKVLYSNKLWRTKFEQMWPDLATCDIFNETKISDWKDTFKRRIQYGRKTRQIIQAMSPRLSKTDELSDSDLSEFAELSSGDKFALRFMIDELMQCIHHKERYKNLTDKYYSEKALRFLRQIDVAEKWGKYKALPQEDQLLEHGAVLVAQWCQPTLEITYELIGKRLDEIAAVVRNKIGELYGSDHPSLQVSQSQQEQWRFHNITDNQFPPKESRHVITALSKVLFDEMGFFGNNELYYSHENSFINSVLDLKRGIPITLSILYESVARRLGVKCEPVSFPGHFLLRWRDRYLNDGFGSQYFYIDVFNGGVFLTKESCPQFAAQSRCPMSEIFRHGPASATQVVERMANNLEVAGRQRTHMNGRGARLRSALELLHMINPFNLNCLLQLARFYMLYNMDLKPLMKTINDLQPELDARDRGQAAHIMQMLQVYDGQQARRKEAEPQVVEEKRRNNVEVEYAVGMVMHHRRYDYYCVIFGWDPTCSASEEWMLQMGIHSLTRAHAQPFYNVLVNDGSTRYAAEENLELVIEECWVDHHDIGRYFEEFCGTYYIPNKEKQQEYPDDLAVCTNRVYKSTM